MIQQLGQDLIARTVVVLSLATALVAIAIAVDLPRSANDHLRGVTITSEGALLAYLEARHQELIRVSEVAAEVAGDPSLRAYAAGLAARYAGPSQTVGHRAVHAEGEPVAPRLRSLTGLLPNEVDVVYRSDMLALHDHLHATLTGLGTLKLSDPTATRVDDLRAKHHADAEYLRGLTPSSLGR
jgi:hypothetical protein